MLRKFFGALFCLGVLLGSVSATAAGETGSIGVMLAQEGEVTLYRVGDLTETGYRLAELYGGHALTFDELLSPELAAILAREAKDGVVRQADQGVVTYSGLEPGIYLLVQTACEEESVPFSPFMVTLPWDGDQWDVEVRPREEGPANGPPKTGQDAGVFLAMTTMLLSGLGIMACTMAERDRKRT